MTVPRRHSRRPLALLASIGILVLGHSATQDSPNKWMHALPLLLILILGELVREWTVARLAPSNDVGVTRRRHRVLWLTLTAGLALIALPIVAVQMALISKFSQWPLTYLAAGIVCLGVSSAIMFVQAQDALDAKRAAMRLAGESPAFEPPGPLTILLVVLAALVFFVLINATVIETLVAHQALSTAQWIRIVVSALGCSGLAFLVLHRIRAIAEAPSEPARPEAG